MKNKKWLFALVFAGIVFIDWLYATQNGYYRMIAANALGILMGILTLRCYPYDKEKYKKPDIIWLGIWLVGSVIGNLVWFSVKGPINEGQYLMAAIDVGILGFTLIRVLFTKFWKRICRKKEGLVGILFAVMSLWMVLSRHYEIWQIWFFGMFLCFYLTRMEEEEENLMWDALSLGFIWAFFMIQIWAYGFRPYDEVRYLGPYSNTNMTALFYLVTYMMVLYRIHVLHWREKEGMVTANGWQNRLWKVFYYVLAGGLVSFIFFTICRTALLVLIGLTFLFGIISNLWMLREKVYRLILRWVALALCAVITFPCVYGTIRYLPCILHRPVWFGAEYHEDKVHSFDPWNSWRYISLEEFLETAVGRMDMGKIVGDASEQEEGSKELMEVSPELFADGVDITPVSEAETPEAETSEGDITDLEMETASAAEDDGLLRGEDAQNSGRIRLEIWKHYLSDLNMTGHTVTEGHYQITEDFHAWHAQNIFVQMLYNYGIPAGAMFILLMIWYGLKSIAILFKAKEPTVLLPGMVFVVFMGFGMLECVWYPGQAILILMYVVAKRLLRKAEK